MGGLADAAGERILDRDHGKIGRAILDRGEAILERRQRHGLGGRENLRTRDMRIGAGLALDDDFPRGGWGGFGFGGGHFGGFLYVRRPV